MIVPCFKVRLFKPAFWKINLWLGNNLCKTNILLKISHPKFIMQTGNSRKFASETL